MPTRGSGKKYDRGQFAIDVQPNGPGNQWEYMVCTELDAVDAPRRTLTRREAPDPSRANAWIFVGNTPGDQGNVTSTLTIRRNLLDALEGLRDCQFGLRWRLICAGQPDDTTNFLSIDMMCRTQITSIGRTPGIGAMEGTNNDQVLATATLEAGELIEYISEVIAERIQSDLLARDFNKVRYCGSFSCGDCDDLVSDECDIWNAVTDAGTGAYASPYLVTYDSRPTVPTVTTQLIDYLLANEHATDFICVGDRISVVSPQGGFGTSIDGGATWAAVTGAVAGNMPYAVYNSQFEAWAVGDNGYIYYTTDGGQSWVVQDAGTATGNNLRAVDGRGNRRIVAVGALNTVVRTQNGGRTWAAVTGPSAGDNLTAVATPRRSDIYVGNDVGELYRSIDYGDNWTQITLDTGGQGTVQDIQFCGPCGEGEFGWLLHTLTTGASRVFRTLDGGFSWSLVGNLPTNNGLNSIACCDHSEAVAVGEIESTYGVIIEIEKET